MDKHVYDSLINQVDSELLKARGEIKKLKNKLAKSQFQK